MPLKVTCAICGGVLHAPEDAGGKKGKCPNCGNILPIPVDAPRVSDTGLPIPDSHMPPGPFGPPLPTTQAVSNPVPRPAENRGFGSTMAAPYTGTSRKAPAAPPPPANPVPSNPFAGAPPEKGAKAAVPSPANIPQTLPPGGKSWLRAAKALGTLKLGLFFITLGFAALAGVTLADAFGVNLPNQDPGYAKIEGLPANSEIAIAAFSLPTALGMVLALMGRVGFMGVPKASFAKGPATLSALFSVLKVAGVLGFAFMAAMMLKEGSVPKLKSGYSPFLPLESIPGQIQRFGLLAFVVAGVLAESFFVNALGRVGASQKHPSTAGRATTICFFGGLGVLSLAGFIMALGIFGNKELKTLWDSWYGLTPNKQVGYLCGSLAVVAIVGFVLYARAISAARDALREAANRAQG